jgi:hypothetical protein
MKLIIENLGKTIKISVVLTNNYFKMNVTDTYFLTKENTNISYQKGNLEYIELINRMML